MTEHSHKQQVSFGMRFGRFVHGLLGITEWKVNADFVKQSSLRQTPDGLDGIGQCFATPAYLEADVEFATIVSRERLRQSIIHEHLHIVMAEIRALAQRSMTGNELAAYNDAEERAVTRLERALDDLLKEVWK